MKFSLIVPVYNTYDYLEKCLKSLINQKDVKGNFEIIIINDGTPDRSEEIILTYQKKYHNLIKYFKKENGGLSSARNLGIKKSRGDYLLFIDSDDYLDEFLLSKLEKTIDENNYPDLIRIDTRDVKENGELIQNIVLNKHDNQISLIKNIMGINALEVPWAYVYNSKFFKTNKFEYTVGVIHEDYGLTPVVIYKADSIAQLSYIGYNYVERQGSIIAETNYEKLKKRVNDMHILYLNHMKIIKGDTVKGKLLRSYSLEAMLNKLATLNKKDLKQKLEEMKNDINISDIYCYNLNKVIKKILLSINIRLYLLVYKKRKSVR